MLTEVDVGTLDIERLIGLLGPADAELTRDTVVRAREALAGRSIWNVNSTARGGGVAEMLVTLLAYARGVDVDTRWLVIDGDEQFFHITKRLHNRLHGADGDGGPLGEEERAAYESTLKRNCEALLRRIRPGDVVILHDPQTAGLIPAVHRAGVAVIWRCHVGVDHPNQMAREAWNFLAPYVEQADKVVFSRPEFAWENVDPDKRFMIAPSIDALAPKNQPMEPETAAAILTAAGIRAPATADGARPVFQRFEGTTGIVRARATIDEDRPLGAGDRYVLQVSRWDRLKDPEGVIEGYAAHIALRTDAHLLYAGPAVEAVADDPEGAAVLEQARAQRTAMSPAMRERVHLAMLPMDDLEENAAIVNALQREAAVVVQKSLAEGFGLTVAEAMWKARPVVASRIGGIADQIEDGRSGVLLDDPRDLVGYGAAVVDLLDDDERAVTIGIAAREQVRAHFLGTRSLVQYFALIEQILTRTPAE